MEKPGEGNTFLFIGIRIGNTGTGAVPAPSAQQFVVNSDGKMFNYSSVHRSDVVIDNVSWIQYDYKIGLGGNAGCIQPGESNQADGYLIGEIPATFSPGTTSGVSNPDSQKQTAGKPG
jgi:hypothetical protein